MSASFQIEKLEDRILLAGNITAVQNGSQLVINGDADDNYIRLDGTGDGSVNVSEFDGGTVNGGGTESFSGITHIVIRGRAGDDRVQVLGVDIDGNLTIQLNNGDGGLGFQAASVSSSDVGGNLAISSDGGTDTFVTLIDNDIAGAARIVTGNGDDLIKFDDNPFGPNAIGGDLVINANHGDNEVFLGGFEGGLDVGGNLVVLDGADDLELFAFDVSVGGNLNINAGARGDSEILLHRVDVGGQMWVRTGDGEDSVELDLVEVDLGTVIALREGDDVLVVEDSMFHSHFQASGGPHEAGDVFDDDGGNIFDVAPIITRFEIFGP